MNVLVAAAPVTSGRIPSSGSRSPVTTGHLRQRRRGHKAVAEILKVPFVWAGPQRQPTLTRALADHRVDAVMHFAAYAYVGESVEKPLMYYQNNVATTISVLESMADTGVNRFVFSSTCAVYGDPDKVPITKTSARSPSRPTAGQS